MKDPRRQVNVSEGETQCPAIAQYDGANCCALVEGHPGQHENHFHDDKGPWGTFEEWLVIERALKRRDHELN